MVEVSGNRKVDRKTDPNEWQDVRLAVVRYDFPRAICSCGWKAKKARRLRVLDDRIDRHLAKRHEGKGIRL